MEIIASLIEGGCYSAVFAVLLFVSLKTGTKRENCYREVICGLVGELKELDTMNGKLDRLIEICDKINTKDRKKKSAREGVCDLETPVLSAKEVSSAA